MTREEITNSRAYQATKAALEYYNEHHQDKDIDLTDAFEAGFEYADETNGKELLYVAQKTVERTKKEVIRNACEWLDNINTDDYMDSGIFQMYNLINDFKKAIEL